MNSFKRKRKQASYRLVKFWLNNRDVKQQKTIVFLNYLTNIIERNKWSKKKFYGISCNLVKKGNHYSKVIYLLSKKYQKNIDENFFNEQIRYFILKYKIKDKTLMNFVNKSEINIKSNDYESAEKINQLESLIVIYTAIELFCPLDLIFFKIK